jgi:c(7)-type cytochrome triheme protein
LLIGLDSPQMYPAPAACVPFLAVLAAVALFSGCSPNSPTLAGIFVPLPPSTKTKNPPRHPPPAKPEVVTLVMDDVVVLPTIDWNAIYLELPRDGKGVVDWMRALSENTITPKPGIDAATPEASTTDEEVEFIPREKPSKNATFRHATHTQWMACKNCHPAIFKKKSDNLQFTHDDMDAGKYCGACHGKVVVVQGGCNGCHVKKKA